MKAAHFVQWYHLRGARDLTQYAILICNAALDPEVCRESAPGAEWFASFDAMNLSLAGPDDPLFNGMREEMLPAVLKDEDGRAVQTEAYNSVYFDYRMLDYAAQYGRWIAQNSRHGIYLDMYVPELPPSRLRDLPVAYREEQAAAWVLWREALFAALAEEAAVPIIANTAGMLEHRADGICIEASHSEGEKEVEALGRFTVAYNEGATHNIDWAGKWEMPELNLFRGEFL